jgi:hypothetical protein
VLVSLYLVLPSFPCVQPPLATVPGSLASYALFYILRFLWTATSADVFVKGGIRRERGVAFRASKGFAIW